MLDDSIRFNRAHFPDGFPHPVPIPAPVPLAGEASSGPSLQQSLHPAPPAVIQAAPLIYDLPPPAPPSAIQAAPLVYDLLSPAPPSAIQAAPFVYDLPPPAPPSAIQVAPFVHDLPPPAPPSAIQVAPFVHVLPPPAPPSAIQAAPIAYDFPPPAPLLAIETTPFLNLLQPCSPPIINEEFAPTFLSSSLPPVESTSSWSTNLDFASQSTDGLEHYADNLITHDDPMVTIEYAILPPINPTPAFHKELIWIGDDPPLPPNFRADAKNSLKNSPWKCPIYLTTKLYLAALWVGKGNPWASDELGFRRLITGCFLTATELSKTTVRALHDNPRKYLLSNLQVIV